MSTQTAVKVRYAVQHETGMYAASILKSGARRQWERIRYTHDVAQAKTWAKKETAERVADIHALTVVEIPA